MLLLLLLLLRLLLLVLVLQEAVRQSGKEAGKEAGRQEVGSTQNYEDTERRFSLADAQPSTIADTTIDTTIGNSKWWLTLTLTLTPHTLTFAEQI